MIKIFRHIRKSLLMENRTSKYFKYAIGEIILVVIGILIALQINNWNEKSKEKMKSKEYHQRMVEELDLMITTFKNDSTRSARLTKNLISTVNILQKPTITKKEMDTLDFTFRNYFQFVRLSGNLNSYDEMKSSGDLGLIYNSELRKSINSYLRTLAAVSKIYDQLADKVNDSEFLDKYIRQEVSINSRRPKVSFDVTEIKKDKRLINILSRYGNNWNTKKQLSTLLMNQSKKLKNLIQKEIDK